MVLGPVLSLRTLLVVTGGRFLNENGTFMYGGIVFIEKLTYWKNLDSFGASTVPQNIQNSQYFHFEKRSYRSGILSRTLAPKHENYGAKAALWLNYEKIVGLVHLDTCSD